MRLELTKRADYAIRAVLALARATPGERRSVREIAEDQRIPARFLPRAMTDLIRAGLVEATVGRRGGYRLTRPAASISLLEVVEAIEGDSRRRVCILRDGPCSLEGVCDVHEVVIERLRSATIAEAVAHPVPPQTRDGKRRRS